MAKYKTTEETKTSIFSVVILVFLIVFLIYIILVAVFLGNLMNGNFQSGVYYNMLFWITIVVAIFIVALGIYNIYEIYKGYTTTIYNEIEPAPTPAPTPAPAPQRAPMGYTGPSQMIQRQPLPQTQWSSPLSAIPPRFGYSPLPTNVGNIPYSPYDVLSLEAGGIAENG